MEENRLRGKIQKSLGEQPESEERPEKNIYIIQPPASLPTLPMPVLPVLYKEDNIRASSREWRDTLMKLRGLLSLISIQSTPLTVVSLGLGYASVTGTILEPRFIHLAVVGAIAHWAFYCMNDLYDFRWDDRQGRGYKPLVSEDITYTAGLYTLIVLFAISVAYAIAIFPYEAFIPWFIAYIAGIEYNRKSKTEILSGVYLAIWGISIIFTGALYAGGYNGITAILGLLLAYHMFWMTLMGNLKDVGHGEISIPERLGCKIISENGYSTLWTSARFNIVAISVIIIQIILLLIIPIGDGAQSSDPLYIYIAIGGALAIWHTFMEVMYQPGFDRDSMKKDIAKFEVASASFVILVSLSFMSVNTAAVMVVGTIVWGLVWQTVLYSHPLRFP